MRGSASTCAPASSQTRTHHKPAPSLSSGGMRDERAANDSDLRAAAMAQERVDANLFAVAHDQRQQAMASSASLSTRATVAGCEWRLKDAASKKRLAREQRQHQHHKHRKHQHHHQLQQEHQASGRADSLTTAAAGAHDALVVASLDAESRAVCEQIIKPQVTDQSSPPSRSILETVKCWSHPLVSRWLLARTTSDPSASGKREEVDKHGQQVARNVNANLSGSSGWTSGTRQTTSEAVLSASAAAAARTRRCVVVVGESSSAPPAPPKQRQSARNKRNQTASLRLNRLLAKSLADTAMLPVRPASMRAAAHPTRATRSVYVKPIAASASSDARRSSFDMSATAPVSGVGNYAQNIVGQQGFRSNLVKPREIVKTIGEEEEAELEYAANVDGGYAWVILIVVFVINASTWGTARAYGQIFEKLARESGMARTQAAMPFTIMGAVENMAGPLSGCLLALTKSWRITVAAGSTLITLAHLFAGLAANSQLGQLLSMGLMCGLGLSLVSISFFQVNNAYFVRYRNTAFGVGLAGAVFGTLLISPLCQYFLDNYEGTRACYLMLSLFISPNIALALLLKPKRQLETFGGDGEMTKRNDSLASSTSSSSVSITDDDNSNIKEQMATISKQVEERARRRRRRRSSQGRDPTDMGIMASIRLVVANPLFHLIWPTQLIFCWFNFVFGMIIVDFGKDRGLNAQDVAHLVPAWAFGQLVGRLLLSSLVDLKFLTYKSFTIICFLAIGVTMHLLNHARLEDVDELVAEAAAAASNNSATNRQHYLTILILVFVLSMFIALLYILLNGLVFNYVETGLQPLSLGISSFTGSFFLLPRANIIGYYRDTTGNYDEMLTMFTYVSMCAALVWLTLPPLCKYLKDLSQRIKRSREMARKSIQSTRPYSAWQLDQQQHAATNDHQV